MKTTGGSAFNWRTLANAVAAIACVAAGVWVYLGGQRAFLISYVDLGFHELGHLLFSWAPGLVPPLAGSVTQILVPLGLALYFAARRESYGTALLLAWAATSAANVSVYAADAPMQALTLLGNGRHDWAWVFQSLGHMEWAAPFSTGMRWFGVALAAVGLLVAAMALLAPHARARADARTRAEREAREAELRARAPRREPRNLAGQTGRDRRDFPVKPQAPAAPAGRY